MPYVQKTQEQLEYEHQLELDEQARIDQVRRQEMAHELELAKTRADREVSVARIKFATAPRQVAVTRVILAVVKLPALVILAIAIPVMTLAKVPTPPSLEKFLDL